MNRVRGTIVLHDLRVVDGDVGDSLVELVHWISTLAHDVSDKPIRLGHRPRWLIYETGLNVAPRLEIPLARLWRERDNVETFALLLPARQPASPPRRLPCSDTARSYSGPNRPRR